MATYDIEDPTTGKSLTLEGDAPPTEEELNQIFAQVHGTPSAPSQPSFMQKVGGGVRRALDIYGSSQFGSPQDLMNRADSTVRSGFNKAGEFAAQDIARQGGNPKVAAGVGTAIQMAPDLASLAGPSDETDLGQGPVNSVYKKVVPPILKSTKGIPPAASRLAIDNPEVLSLPGNSQSVQQRSQEIIDAVKAASQKIGGEFSQAYRNAGMESPVDAIKAGRPAPYVGQSFDNLRRGYNDAVSGDLFKVPDAVGSITEMTPQEKLSNLTGLKRALQDQAIYPAPGQQLAPSQGAQNAAIKQMAASIDKIRGGIPGGDSLALADDAYTEMQGLKHTLMTAFRDPATGQDYLNRILKGNTDWLTSGRNAAKVGAIQRVEQITGRQVLQPALKEMAAAYVNNPDTMGLPSTGLKSILTSLIPTKSLLRPPKMAARGLLGVGNAAAQGLSNLANNTYGQGQNVQGSNQNPAQTADNNGGYQNGQNANNGDVNGVLNQGKTLTEDTARAFMKMAGGIADKARELARKYGYTF